MDGLALILALVALVVAFNARKAAKALELALARAAARQREMEVDLERLASRRPDVAARDPHAAASDVEAQQAPSVAAEPASPEPDTRACIQLSFRARGGGCGSRTLGWRHSGGAARHALGRLGRRACAGARRRAAGALLDRAGRVRSARAGCTRRSVLGAAHCSRRVVPALRARVSGAGHPGCSHSGHLDGRRHHQRLRHGLCRARPLRFCRSGGGFRGARCHRHRHHARGRAARTSSRRSRPRWRVCRAHARRLAAAQPVARRALSRGGRRGGVCAGAAEALAVACFGCRHWRCGLGLFPARPGRRRYSGHVDVRAIRPRRDAAGARGGIHGAGAASGYPRRCCRARLDRDPGPGRANPAGSAGARGRPHGRAMDYLCRPRHGHPDRYRLAQRPGRGCRRAGRHRRPGRYSGLARPDGSAGA